MTKLGANLTLGLIIGISRCFCGSVIWSDKRDRCMVERRSDISER
jgi:hypothetical protein